MAGEKKRDQFFPPQDQGTRKHQKEGKAVSPHEISVLSTFAGFAEQKQLRKADKTHQTDKKSCLLKEILPVEKSGKQGKEHREYGCSRRIAAMHPKHGAGGNGPALPRGCAEKNGILDQNDRKRGNDAKSKAKEPAEGDAAYQICDQKKEHRRGKHSDKTGLYRRGDGKCGTKKQKFFYAYILADPGFNLKIEDHAENRQRFHDQISGIMPDIGGLHADVSAVGKALDEARHHQI